MKAWLLIPALLFAAAGTVSADETVSGAAETETIAENEANGDGIESPRSMSGMSILGNEEAPKALVIIPWKSSELGDEIGLDNTLEDLAKPVDKEVFLRELRYYEIRAGKADADGKEQAR